MFGGLENYPYLCIVTFVNGWDRVDSTLPYIFFIRVLLNNPRPFWWIEKMFVSLEKIYTP